MKALIAAFLVCLATNSFAATRNIVPRTTGEGGIGTSSKIWGDGYFDDITVTYGVAGATLAVTGAGDIAGQATFGAANHKSTMTADGSLTLHTGMTASTITLTGAFAGANTLAIQGAAYFGATANATVSTITAAGVANFHGALTAATLTSVAGVSGTTIAGSGAVTGATTLAIQGAIYLGANASATVSTVTAAGAASFHTSVTAPAITGSTSVSGAKVTASAGPMTLTSKTIAELMALTPAVVGEIYFCNNCSPVEVAVSTAAGAPNTGGFGNAVGLQLD